MGDIGTLNGIPPSLAQDSSFLAQLPLAGLEQGGRRKATPVFCILGGHEGGQGRNPAGAARSSHSVIATAPTLPVLRTMDPVRLAREPSGSITGL